MKTMTDKTAGLVSKPGAVQQIDLFESFSMMVNFQLMALARWDSDKGNFQGEVAGQIAAVMNFTISENFFAGPIPAANRITTEATAKAGFRASRTTMRWRLARRACIR